MRLLNFKIIILFITTLFYSYAQTVDNKAAAVATFTKVEQSDRWVNNFSNQDLVELPIGVRKTINNSQYAIGITKARFTPEYTQLTVFCKIDLPQTTENGDPIQLFFGADDIKLSHDGGIIGDAKLVLLGDVDVPFNANKWQLSLYGGFDMQTGNVQDLTYVTIDCDGFKDMKITGAVEFSRDLIIPLEANGTVNEAKTTVSKTFYNGTVKQVPYRVKGAFSFEASDWNDILVNVTLQPFVLKDKRNGNNYDGNFQFLVNNAVFDFSDIKNHPSVIFPQYYADHNLLIPTQNTWRGVYVETFDVALPKEFKTTNTAAQNQRVSIGASKLIIDKFGVSGTFYADNVFPLDRGITSEEKSWAYSLDHIDVTIAANKFVKANLSGEILLPITKYKTPQETQNNVNTTNNTDTSSTSTTTQTQPIPQTARAGLVYNGFISLQEQSLNVITKDSISFDLWKAKGLLLPNSSVELKIVNGKFLPKANLHGTISIGTNRTATDTDDGGEKKTVAFEGITFENLQLQTVSPYISVGSMGYQGTVEFANFPVSIGNINISTNNTEARIDFDLGINLMDSSSFAATARLGIKGVMVDDGYKQKWKFNGLDLSAIMINAEFSGFTMKGRLDLLENDPIYGDGFNAELEVKVNKPEVTVSAKAMFGRTTFRYWYFDAKANWPVTAATFMINGFGGGAYYKMKRNPNISPTDFSPSGLSYTPNENMGLGLKAMVGFVVGSDKACNGEAGLEVLFNANGGINTIAIFGKAAIAAKIPGMENIQNTITKMASDVTSKTSFLGVSEQTFNGSFANKFLPKAKAIIPTDINAVANISAEMAIEVDFQNNTLHGSFDVYITTPGNFISGIGANGRAGWAVFHKDPDDWYLYVGTPDDRCGIKMGVAGIYLKTTSYLMAGTQLPGSPPPPSIVADILGVDANSLNYMRDENSLANGGGFAFGSSLDFDTGDLSFLIFYARFQAGIGFDIMLKDYGGARCSNTGDQVGINGWYANGQAYAYLQGELGVRVKLLFVNLKIPVISGGAAVLLQAKLPNPVWLRGYVGGQLNVLGGLIKGRFRFKMTIGEECIFENGSPLGGIKMITDVSPKATSTDIDVFAIPQATFSLKVNEPIVIPEDSGDETYKVILEKFKLLDNGVEIPSTIEWSTMKDRASLVSTDILPPNKQLKVEVELSFKKLINGVFQPVMVDGQVAKEYEERLFTTGTAPNYIPLTNIQYSYPVVEQKYFFEEEYNNGYIKLKRGQDYLFEDANWETKVKFIEASNNYNTAFTYNTNTNEIAYDLPNLNQSKNYLFKISSNLKTSENSIASTTTSNSVVNDDENGNDISVTQNTASSVSKDGEIERLSYTFNTSKYKTFKSKMNAISTQNYNFGILYPDVIYLENTISSSEAFDLVDLQGSIYTENSALIQAESALTDTYFTTDINPPLYSQYPLGGQYEITTRDTDDFGITPIRALPLNAHYLVSIEYDVNQNWTKSNFPFKYNLPLIYKQDWVNLKNQIVNDFVSGLIPSTHPSYTFVSKDYQFMRFGFYEIKLKYTLPGNKKVTEDIYRFKNLNNFR